MPLSGWPSPGAAVTIDNTGSSSNLTYYQVPVMLSGPVYTAWAATGLATGADLRVTDSDGTTVLGHWLEGIDAANSVVYLLVKVPFVAAGASRTIYVYWGNAGASSVSSAATTIGPTVAATAFDLYTQSDTAGYVNGEGMVLLKNQTGGNASHNGDVLVFASVGGSGDQFSNCKLVLLRCPAGSDPATAGNWTKTTILTPAASNCAAYRAVGEMADGTLLLCYGYDTNAVTLAGKAKLFVAKSTDAGATWTNLSTAASNQLATPYVTGTDIGTAYVKIVQDASLNFLMCVYGAPVGANHKAFLMACPAASDPTNGSNWSSRGTIFNGVADGRSYNEPDILNVGGSNWIAVSRTDAGAPYDLYRATSADNGATWGAAAAMGLPPAAPGATNNPVSPYLLMLASGNVLLANGARQGTAKWGSVVAISTDGGATFIDRPACGLMLHAAAQLSSDWGYPCAAQLADGRILVAGYHAVGSFLTNLELAVMTEDYALNSGNAYSSCDSFDSLWSSHGANATTDTTVKHGGTGSIKLDNNSGTGGTGANATFRAWPDSLTGAAAMKWAFSAWENHTACVSGQANVTAAQDATPTRRVLTADLGSTGHVEWNNGAAYQDTGVTAGGGWWKLGVRASVTASSASARISKNNADLGASVTQFASGDPAQQIQFQAGSGSTTNNCVMNVDDVYSHQYTPTPPAVATAVYQDPIFPGGLLAGMSIP